MEGRHEGRGERAVGTQELGAYRLHGAEDEQLNLFDASMHHHRRTLRIVGARFSLQSCVIAKPRLIDKEAEESRQFI
jgi:hypothetical protein